MKNLFILPFLILFIFNSDCSFSQWSVYSLPYSGLAYRTDFLNLNTGVACGHSLMPVFSGNIFYTTNSGANWNLSSFPPDIRAVSGVYYINPSLVLACGAQNGFLYNTPFSGFSLSGSRLSKNSLAKGISSRFEYYKGLLMKSTNAGIIWTKVGNPDSLTGYINDIHFFDANTGYAAIDTNPSGYPKICKTTNGGLNWQKLFKLDSNFITENIHFLDLNTGFFCGYQIDSMSVHSSIYRTTNGGINWSQKRFPYTQDIYEISFFNSTTGIAVGGPNGQQLGTKIFRTTNSGITWDSVFFFPDYVPEFIKTLSGTGTAFGSGYLAYDTMTVFSKTCTFKSTNYGLNWVTKTFTTNRLIVDGNLIDQNNFFMSGGDLGTPAVILKSTNGGNVFVNQIGNEIPASYKLSQNFPNPFNPSTNIRYKIPEITFVTLKIYNILGKEVSILVNGKQTPGEYEATFDGSSLSSGIYFCTLRTDNFSDTKKMIMIK
ncbi:MAG: T9SS type A sorting domain-containing protein [Ignavibacteriae bacterium]|nr:T9SS type A sorting domain-containing protein [Ignavibacteriota bacterium]